MLGRVNSGFRLRTPLGGSPGTVYAIYGLVPPQKLFARASTYYLGPSTLPSGFPGPVFAINVLVL